MLTLDAVLDYLALGLDPAKATFFRQSHVPQVCELAWILGTVTGMGLLERAHSFKDKVAKGLKPSVGLFYYPVLMAADILSYKADLVPVGQDQVQHIEMTQDMAQYFNNTYRCQVFVRPEVRLNQTARVPGTDGEKMSKSYGNTLDLQDSGKELKKKIMGIKTDSLPLEAPKDPARCTVFALFSLCATTAEQEDLAARYRAGGLGYGEAKKALLGKVEEYFGAYRSRRADLLKNLDYPLEVLRAGAQRAQRVAQGTLDEAKRAAGLL
jgi:tryptophanyl-tRNA synthetase